MQICLMISNKRFNILQRFDESLIYDFRDIVEKPFPAGIAFNFSGTGIYNFNANYFCKIDPTLE